MRVTAKTVSRNVTLQMAHASLEAKRKLDLQRIFMPTRPANEFPDLPEDPTELFDSDLMRLFVRLTKWAEYLSAQLAVAEVDERYAEAGVERVRAVKGFDFRKPDVKTKAYTDEDFLAAQESFEAAHAYRKLVNVAYTNAERNSSLLSRELTRRVNRTEGEGRVGRWAT